MILERREAEHGGVDVHLEVGADEIAARQRGAARVQMILKDSRARHGARREHDRVRLMGRAVRQLDADDGARIARRRPRFKSRRFVDGAIAGEPTRLLVLIAMGYLGLAISGQLARMLTAWLASRLAWDGTNRLREDLAAHALDLDMAYHGQRTPGEMIERVDGDVLRGKVHDPTAQRMGGVAGHAGVFTTTADLARVARMVLNGGELEGVQILKPETVKQMTRV